MTSASADDRIRLADGDLVAEVSLLGAEPVRLDLAGRPLLWHGDPAVWAGRAPLLFPIVGTLAGDRLRHHGHIHALPRHGFARRSLFTPIEVGATRTTLRLEASAATLAVWPFAFRLDVTHAIEAGGFLTRAVVTNLGDAPMPTSFGFHHGFMRPLPGAGPAEAHRIVFAEAEPAPIRRLDGAGLVDPRPRPSPVVGREMRVEDELFLDDVVFFDAIGSRRLRYGTCAAALEIDFPDMPHLGVWTKPGAPFLCIEPWQGHSDPTGFDGEIADKPGTVALAPGAARAFAMRVTPVASVDGVA